jgi:hypothetical protein
MGIMNPKLFLVVRTTLVIALLSIGVAHGHPQQSQSRSEASASHQLPGIEGKWVLAYDSAGVLKTRIFTFERDKDGRFIATLDEPGVCPCDVLVSLKGNKLKLRVTPHKPTRVVPPLPPNVVLGEPLSTIYEAKVIGDTMEGKFYLERAGVGTTRFTGNRESKAEAAVSPTKN